jgi:hypothetical protein
MGHGVIRLARRVGRNAISDLQDNQSTVRIFEHIIPLYITRSPVSSIPEWQRHQLLVKWS